MYLEKDIRVYIFEKSRKERPLFHECYHFDLHLRTSLQDLRVVEKSFLILEGGRGLIPSIRTQNRGLRNTSYASIDVAFSQSPPVWKMCYREGKVIEGGGGGEKREIRGKGKDGGTNKVHRRGWRDSRW